MTTKSVKAPKGFHWMKKGSSFKLMKGTYKPHKGAYANMYAAGVCSGRIKPKGTKRKRK